jgi:hypothetical protein
MYKNGKGSVYKMSWENDLRDDNISESYKLVGEWKVYVGRKRIGIKVWQNSNGKYDYDTSHFYQGPQQPGPHQSSRANLGTDQEALLAAESQILSYYDSNYNDDKYWKLNNEY